MPPGPSYPSPNGAQMAQGAMPYYSNRQMTTDELLSAELSREASGPNLGDGSSNGVHHGQGMVLSSSNAGDMGRPSNEDQHQHQHMLQFPPSQQVGVDPNHDLSYGEQSARKRSKISRACDECRRKKVRRGPRPRHPSRVHRDARVTAANIVNVPNNRFDVTPVQKPASRHARTVAVWVLCANLVACP